MALRYFLSLSRTDFRWVRSTLTRTNCLHRIRLSLSANIFKPLAPIIVSYFRYHWSNALRPFPVPVVIWLDPPAVEDNPTQVGCIGHLWFGPQINYMPSKGRAIVIIINTQGQIVQIYFIRKDCLIWNHVAAANSIYSPHFAVWPAKRSVLGRGVVACSDSKEMYKKALCTWSCFFALYVILMLFCFCLCRCRLRCMNPLVSIC